VPKYYGTSYKYIKKVLFIVWNIFSSPACDRQTYPSSDRQTACIVPLPPKESRSLQLTIALMLFITVRSIDQNKCGPSKAQHHFNHT